MWEYSIELIGGNRGRAVKSAVSESLDHLTAVSGGGIEPRSGHM